MADPHSVLKRHLESFALVRFVRPNLEAPGKHLIGVPVALGEQWVVMARMDDAIRLDGFDALRLSDMAAVETTFRRRSFYLRGLRMKRARTPMLSQLNLRTTRTLLEGVQRWYSLITLDREAGSSAGCDVGKITRFATRTCTPNYAGRRLGARGAPSRIRRCHTNWICRRVRGNTRRSRWDARPKWR